MKLGSLLNWATMVLHHLSDPQSASRERISKVRMEEKLGWLREFKCEVTTWAACQGVVDRALEVIHRQGLDSQTADRISASFKAHDQNWEDNGSSSTRISLELIDWTRRSSSRLGVGERSWLSTELLESLFGRFKQLERQPTHREGKCKYLGYWILNGANSQPTSVSS